MFKREVVASEAWNLIPPPREYVSPKAQNHQLPWCCRRRLKVIHVADSWIRWLFEDAKWSWRLKGWSKLIDVRDEEHIVEPITSNRSVPFLSSSSRRPTQVPNKKNGCCCPWYGRTVTLGPFRKSRSEFDIPDFLYIFRILSGIFAWISDRRRLSGRWVYARVSRRRPTSSLYPSLRWSPTGIYTGFSGSSYSSFRAFVLSKNMRNDDRMALLPFRNSLH